MKTYVLMISKVFPATHSKAGQPTLFKEKIEKKEKITTIRKNYEYWKKRIDEVNKGNAVLSVREWEGKPRHSDQTEVFQFGKGEVGIQKLTFNKENRLNDDRKYQFDHLVDDKYGISTYTLSRKDALSVEDFSEWFAGFKTPEPYAIIHFTNFRY